MGIYRIQYSYPIKVSLSCTTYIPLFPSGLVLQYIITVIIIVSVLQIHINQWQLHTTTEYTYLDLAPSDALGRLYAVSFFIHTFKTKASSAHTCCGPVRKMLTPAGFIFAKVLPDGASSSRKLLPTVHAAVQANSQ